MKKLLDSILEIKSNIFINSQIVNEVNRNKLSITSKSLISHLKNLENIKPSNLPEHLEMEGITLKNWNAQSKSLHQERKELQKGLEALIHKTLEEIMLSTDKVSATFNSLFKDALEASEPEIQAARSRREVGNPPGKPNDPLGDQISWEQLLNYSRNSERIWIITNDSDYWTAFKDKRYLNPFLHNELVKNNVFRPSIFCFESLAEGLKHFNKNSSEKLNKLPIDEELNTITEEELNQPKLPNLTSYSVCSICGSTNLFPFTRTVYGSWIECLKCRDCGKEILLDVVYMD